MQIAKVDDFGNNIPARVSLVKNVKNSPIVIEESSKVSDLPRVNELKAAFVAGKVSFYSFTGMLIVL